MRVLIPALVMSELEGVFRVGFVIFIPSLIIDIAMAAVLVSTGMTMVMPSIFPLPFRIILFVLMDDQHLLLGLLAQSFV